MFVVDVTIVFVVVERSVATRRLPYHMIEEVTQGHVRLAEYLALEGTGEAIAQVHAQLVVEHIGLRGLTRIGRCHHQHALNVLARVGHRTAEAGLHHKEELAVFLLLMLRQP